MKSKCIICDNSLSLFTKGNLKSINICKKCQYEFNTYKKVLSEVLKKSTRLKKQKNFIEAINALEIAYKIIPLTGICYGIETYFRLPKYLLKIGQKDESLKAYFSLIDKPLPNQEFNSGNISSNNAAIFKEIAAFYTEDEIKYIAYSLSSFIARIISIRARKASFAFKEFLSKKNIQNTIKNTIRNTFLENQLNEVYEIFQKNSKLKKFDFDEFYSELLQLSDMNS